MAGQHKFTREQLPINTIVLVVKAVDGHEMACYVARDDIPLITPICDALLDALDEYEGKGRLQ